MNKNMKRLTADIFFVLSFLYAPWYVTLLMGVVFLFLFKNFWEFPVLGLAADCLYHIEGAAFYTRFGAIFLFSLAVFLLANKLKSQIRFFDEA